VTPTDAFLPLLQFDYLHSFRPASACTRAEFHYAHVFFGAAQLPLSYSDDLRARIQQVIVAVPRIHYVLDRCLRNSMSCLRSTVYYIILMLWVQSINIQSNNGCHSAVLKTFFLFWWIQCSFNFFSLNF